MKYIYSLLLAGLIGNYTVSAQEIIAIAPVGATPAVEETPENAPKGAVKGTITTVDGKPASFVTVVLKEVNRGTTTGENGAFSIRNLKPGTYTLYISSVGLKPQRQTITLAADQGLELNISLEETASQLAEVIVTDRKSQNDKPVTISKLPVAVLDLPQAIATVGENVIRDQQAQRLSDVVKNINGVYLATTRAGTQESFSARGYGFSSNNMFKNGFRVNTGVMPEMSSLEKVEVLKGSAAILFGNVAPGGVLNMVTKKPKFNGGGEVSMRVGSYDLYKPSFDVYGPVSSNIAYRLNGTYESANSFRDQVSSKRYYVNPSLLFKLGNRTELLVQGDYLKHDFTPDFGIGSVGNTKLSDLPRNTFLGAPWQYAKTQQGTANATIRREFSDSWSISGMAAYQKYNRDYYSLERIQALANGDWGRPLGRLNNDENYYMAQVDLTGKFKTGSVQHTLLFGADADKYKSTAFTYDVTGKIYDSINIFNPGKFVPRTDIPAAAKTKRTITPTTRVGVYIQDLVSISEKLKLLAGIRWSYLESGKPEILDIKTNVTTYTTGKTDKVFSPRLGLVYKPIPTTAVFASYSNSFTQNSGLDIDSNAVKPSLIDQYEIGVKNDLFKGMLSFNVTGYLIKNNNLAQTAPFRKDGQPNNDTNIKALIGETTSKGVEIDIAGHPLPGLDIVAGYSFNEIYVSKSPGTKGSYYKGDRLVNNPNHTANASVFYTFVATKLKGLKLGATAFYTGDRGAGWNNTVGQPAAVPNRTIPVKGYTQLDLSAGYAFKKLSLMAKVSNVTNEYNYYVHENYSVNPIPPTQFTATVAYRFNY